MKENVPLAAGQEIAATLVIGESTVKTHIGSILRKKGKIVGAALRRDLPLPLTTIEKQIFFVTRQVCTPLSQYGRGPG